LRCTEVEEKFCWYREYTRLHRKFRRDFAVSRPVSVKQPWDDTVAHCSPPGRSVRRISKRSAAKLRRESQAIWPAKFALHPLAFGIIRRRRRGGSHTNLVRRKRSRSPQVIYRRIVHYRLCGDHCAGRRNLPLLLLTQVHPSPPFSSITTSSGPLRFAVW